MLFKYLLTAFCEFGLATAAFSPGAPTIQGPVTEAATYIQLINLVQDVRYVAVVDADTDIVVAEGPPTHLRHGKGVVPVTAPLVVGHELVAWQISDATARYLRSPKGEIRVEPFTEPGPPSITSLVHTCISSIQIADVIVGATITITLNAGALISEATAFDTSDIWMSVDRLSLQPNDVITVTQSFNFRGTIKTGIIHSDPLTFFDLFISNADTALEVGELRECQMGITARGGIPGATYDLDNIGASWNYVSPTFDNYLSLGQPLRRDLVTLTQRPLRKECKSRVNPPQKFPVGEVVDPPAPINFPPPCPNSRFLTFTNLVDEGSLVLVYRNQRGETEGLTWSNGNGRVPLPETWNLAANGGSISFYQFDACSSHKSIISQVVVSTDHGIPELHFVSPTEDVYECSSLVVFAGNQRGRTSLWWKNGLTEVQLSTPATFGGNRDLQVIRTPLLWEKLVRGREIFLKQESCGQSQAIDSRLAIGGWGIRTVQSLPKILRTPAFVAAEVLAESKSVKIRNILPGASVRVWVDDVPYGQKESLEDVVEVPLVGPKFPGGVPLREGQIISVVQMFECGPGRKPRSEKASKTVM